MRATRRLQIAVSALKLGWAWSATEGAGHFHVGRHIIVDTMFPWPALHHGRENIRSWLEWQQHQRRLGTEGPIRLNAGLTTAVKEDGEFEMRVWPIDKLGLPRLWIDADLVWREPLQELRRHVSHNLLCLGRLLWMPGGGTIEHVQTVPSLIDRNGFWGWQRGEREPTEKITRSLARELAAQLAGIKSRTIVNTGLRPWH